MHSTTPNMLYVNLKLTTRALALTLLLTPVCAFAQSQERVLRTEKLYTVGDGASTTILSSVTSALFDSQVRLIIADYKESVAVVIDAQGRETGRIGAKGAGPGEYRALDRMGWVGDTLWVFDGTLRRTTFLYQGKLLRTDGTYPNLPAGLSFAVPLSIGATGSQFGLANFQRGTAPAGLPGFLLFRRSERSRSVDTVMWLSRANTAMVLKKTVGGQVGQLIGVQPLNDAPLAAARHSGGFVVVDRPAAASSGVSRVTLRAFNITGAPAFRLDLDVPAVAVTREMRAELRSRLCVSRSTPAPQRMCSDDEADRALWIPPVLAPASAVTGCSDGSIWVRLAESPVATHQDYRGYGPDGASIGRLRLDAKAHILDCRSSRLAVALRQGSSFDPVVTVYRVGG